MKIDRSGDHLNDTWGITPGYWLWPNPIQILLVIDGRIQLSSNPNVFGLGLVLDTLLASFSWWVQFHVDIAKRDGTLPEEALGSHVVTYPSFRFTQPDFNIDAYDQVWFFGDQPNDSAGAITDIDIPGRFPLDNAELKVVAEWMDRGGGVFAAGDHHILGASMCSNIPRVRTMRKWTQKQGVPARDDSSRHQTLQPTAYQEADAVLQPLEVIYRRAIGSLPFLRPGFPHPLLCSTLGVIDRFPDHMHEGEVIADENVQLGQPLDIPGYHRPEYPVSIPTFLASGLTDVAPIRTPRPHVIAYGRTTNQDSPSKRFGLVSAYDGDSAGIGRVVVDSTWHHWFSYNLGGIVGSEAYQKMQAYYRNVGMWLGRPAQRGGMLVSGTWGVLNGSAPMAFDMQMGPWAVGERVLAILARTVSPCMVGEFVAPLLGVLADPGPDDGEVPYGAPSWSRLPEELRNRALVGGIGSALLGLALDDQQRRARGERPRLNREAILQRAVDGAYRGQELLRESVANAAASLAAVHATLTQKATPQPVDLQIPIDVRQLRVVADTLQVLDPADPGLLNRQVTLTIRIRLDRSVVVHRIIENLELPPFNERGSVVDLFRDVGELEVQSGESLSIEVLVGNWSSEDVHPEVIRFQDTLRGDISKWIGKSIPARSQPWRLWYRIEEIETRL